MKARNFSCAAASDSKKHFSLGFFAKLGASLSEQGDSYLPGTSFLSC
jgi:hypothetical protein